MGKTNFKDLTTLKVGGKIKYFREISSEEELIKAVGFAKTNNLPIFILGGGSDIAPSDKDFNGLVIKYTADTIKISKNTITADAGVVWDDLVLFSVKNNLQGLECLSGIPGTVGAAPIQNIGAYGQELSDSFVSLRAYDIENEMFKIFDKKECKFGYRDSIFKSKKYWQKFVITKITFSLKEYNDSEVSLQNIRDEILRTRSEKLVNPLKIPNAGSFFKNPIVKKNTKNTLVARYPDIVIYPLNNEYKISAGWLIEKAGWKGKSLGPVKVSDKHALVLTNPEGKGNFSDIKKLADVIISDVYEKFNIRLEPEVQYINF
ncbi:MAG TPA: UDP-N-acetylmuramate dehydrogenase [Patescibacteria group bacterium]|nr:UDP-N-acetylmuramate dehydrogenase [Patescibacteria group bacterium]